MHETLNRTALKMLKPGSSVNLERAMAAGGRFEVTWYPVTLTVPEKSQR